MLNGEVTDEYWGENGSKSFADNDNGGLNIKCYGGEKRESTGIFYKILDFKMEMLCLGVQDYLKKAYL